MRRPSKRHIEKFTELGLFDADWYVKSYPDVVASGMSAVEHYLSIGARLCRDPAPGISNRFARAAYGVTNPDHEPFTRLADLARRDGAAPQPKGMSVLFAAFQVAQRGGHDLAIKLARQHLPDDLASTANILEANAALARADEGAWLAAFNRYLASRSSGPVSLSGEGSVFDRLQARAPEAVTGGPLVSVIMPAWNAEATVRKAAQSILDQSWQNLELLIVDDASEDGTWAVLQDIAARDGRVKIWRNKVNVGPYVSKNIALKHARGAWITGHDADDYAMPDRLARHIALSEQNGARASIGHMVRVQNDGTFSHIGRVTTFSFDAVARKASISCLFEGDLLRKTLGFWDSVRFGADSEMIARTTAVAGEAFREFQLITMICLDLETSLTNHPEHGVSKTSGISPIRKHYRDSWTAWHKDGLTDSTAYLPFPQSQRVFDASPDMQVSAADARANLAQTAEGAM